MEIKLDGENKKRDVVESEMRRREGGREAERALRQKAFWLKAMTLVSDVWRKKIANLGKG